MAGVSSNPNSPRQRMINLMYLVFIAMMALNVSSEVLNGFELVENSLQTSIENSAKRNAHVKANLDRAYDSNPDKVGEWYEKGVKVKALSDELSVYIEELKLRIVQEADGKYADVNNIKYKDNVEASSRVMLAPVVGEGKELKKRIQDYSTYMCSLIEDPSKREALESIFNTEGAGNSWESELFENMPVSAVVTLLTKMQNDVRYAEGEILTMLLTNVDLKDYRVNDIKAFVIPKSQIVTSGTAYEAELVLAAIDSTRQPEYYLGERLQKSSRIVIPASGVGERSLSGKIIANGETYTYSAKYSVTATSATIAPTLMNFLYESIENDLEIAIPGVPSGSVNASIEGNGQIAKKENNIWTVTGLNMKASSTVKVILSANVGGRNITESKDFRVRELPDPLPFISYKDADGRTRKYTGGLISKRHLVEANGIQAAIDDGVLNVPHTVTGFTMTFIDGMGNYIPEVSNNGLFTQRQKDLIRNLARGKRFYIGNVKAVKPSGEPVNIKYSMDVTVN